MNWYALAWHDICLGHIELCDFLGQAHKWDMTSRLYWFIPVYKYTEYFKATLNGKEN